MSIVSKELIIMDIIETIKEHDGFSQSEEKVKSYIINNPRNIETFTITKLANEAKTSTSAVLRFCQSMGFNGYKDFRFEVINALHRGKQNDDPNSLMDRYLNENISVLNQMKQIKQEQINDLLKSLMNDKVNYLLGTYYSSFPAKELYYGLNDLGKTSLYSHDYINSSHITRSMNENSTLVFFSISGNKREFTQFLPDLTSDMPDNSFLITTNPNAELNKIFPNTIVLPGAPFSNKSVTDAQSIPITFVEMILNLIHDSL